MLLVVAFFSFTFLFVSYFKISYPLKYQEEIELYSSMYGIEKNLVASIINVESGYREKVISKSNAIGLMQLKIDTANDIANRLKEKEVGEEELFVPQLNIKYGCFYIRYLLDYYNQNLNNALCAYNAGLSNVNSWLQEDKYSSDGENLKEIPFSETKNYIKRISRNRKIYLYMYKFY